jgi:hypothetical protein
MNNKTKIISIALFLSVFMMFVSCQKQKAEWKGTIENVDGVTVVKNPKEPIYGEDVFILEEELSIGEAEGRKEYMFSEIRSVAVDEAGRIYVLDMKEAHVKIFGQNGNYIRTIGRKGQGPGELDFPLSIHITSQNELVVEDYRRLAFFSSEGEFKRNLSIAKERLSRIDIDSDGNIIGNVIVREEENPRYEFKKFDSELNYLHSFGSSLLPSVSMRRDGYNPFMAFHFCYINENDQVVYGYPENYEIKIFDKEGNVIRKIMKEYDPVEITKEEIKEETEVLSQDMKLSIPKYHSAYRRFIIDDEGRIFVMTRERVADGEGYYYDVFDSEGKFIVKVPLKTRPYVLKKKKLYTVEEDEEGYQAVKRYKVIWKY